MRLARRIDAAPDGLVRALAALGLCLVFIPMALLRLADGDEGFYLYASKLALAGKIPYRDFFYTQAPLLPYLYGAWMKALGGDSWRAGRLLSALLAAAAGMGLYENAASRLKSKSAGLLGAALFAGSSLAFTWFTVVKTYAPSMAALFAAYLLLDHPARAGRGWRSFVCGACLGLAVDFRVFFVAVAPALALGVDAMEGSACGSRAGRQARFWAGLAIGLAPHAIFFALDPSNYWFGNLGYHRIRDASSAADALRGKLKEAGELFGVALPRFAGGLQFLALFAANVCLLIGRARRRLRPSPASMIFASLFVVSWLPTPAYAQYFCVAVPFMILGALEWGAELATAGGWKSRALLAGSLAYFALAPSDAYRDARSGRSLPPANDPRNAVNWRLSTIAQARRELDARASPGEAVLSWWPGYAVGAHWRMMDRMENHFGLEIPARLSPAERERRRVASPDDVDAWIRERRARWALLGNWVGDWISKDKARYREELLAAGYTLEAKIGDAEIYAAPGVAVSALNPPARTPAPAPR